MASASNPVGSKSNRIADIEYKKKIEDTENELINDPYFNTAKYMTIAQLVDQIKEANMSTGKQQTDTQILSDAILIHDEVKRLKKKQEQARFGRSVI